jgi:hypothetical protein
MEYHQGRLLAALLRTDLGCCDADVESSWTIVVLMGLWMAQLSLLSRLGLGLLLRLSVSSFLLLSFFCCSPFSAALLFLLLSFFCCSPFSATLLFLLLSFFCCSPGRLRTRLSRRDSHATVESGNRRVSLPASFCPILVTGIRPAPGAGRTSSDPRCSEHIRHPNEAEKQWTLSGLTAGGASGTTRSSGRVA